MDMNERRTPPVCDFHGHETEQGKDRCRRYKDEFEHRTFEEAQAVSMEEAWEG